MGGCASQKPQTPPMPYHDQSAAAVAQTRATPAIAESQPVAASQPAPVPPTPPIVSALAFPTGNRETSVLLLEQVSPPEARVGVPYAYELRVTNLTSLPITGIVLDQQIPGDFKLASTSIFAPTTNPASTEPSPNAEAHLRLEVGELAAHESRTMHVEGIPSHPGTFDSSLAVQYDPPALRAHVAVVAPLLKAVAQVPAEADICQEIVCHFSVSNIGTGTAHAVELHEKLPEGLTTVEGEDSVTLAVGDLGPNEAKDFTSRLKALKPGKYVTRAAVASSDAPPAQAEQMTTVVQAPRLAMTVTGPKECYVGQQLTYQVAVTNRGGAPAAKTRLRLGTTPGHAKFVDAEASDGTALKATDDNAEQIVGTIAPGETSTTTVHFHPDQGGPLTIDATVMANCAEPAAASASTNIVTIAATSLTVSHDPEPVAVGSNVVYHITVTNKGTAPDKNVVVTAVLPGSTQYVKASGGTEAKVDALSIAFAPVAILEPGKSVSWEVEAKAVRRGDSQFVASMTTDSVAKPVIRLEPTTLFGLQSGTVTGTSEVSPSTTTPAPTTQPGHFNK
jgi:uncharacterized repeat protein (TIGR01451 family)